MPPPHIPNAVTAVPEHCRTALRLRTLRSPPRIAASATPLMARSGPSRDSDLRPDPIDPGATIDRVLFGHGPLAQGPPAEVIVVRGTARSLSASEKGLLSLRRSRPWAPVVLECEGGALFDSALVRLAHRLGARIVVQGHGSARSKWRGPLSSAARLGDDLADWLRVLRPRAGSSALEHIAALVRAGRRGLGVRDAGRQNSCTPGGIRKALKRARLRPPSEFLRFGRIVPGLLRYAEDPTLSVERAAAIGNYHDAASFSRATLNSLGFRPSQVRCSPVAWEWFAYIGELHEPPRGGHDRRSTG
jgi:hypothetical protein